METILKILILYLVIILAFDIIPKMKELKNEVIELNQELIEVNIIAEQRMEQIETLTIKLRDYE